MASETGTSSWGAERPRFPGRRGRLFAEIEGGGPAAARPGQGWVIGLGPVRVWSAAPRRVLLCPRARGVERVDVSYEVLSALTDRAEARAENAPPVKASSSSRSRAFSSSARSFVRARLRGSPRSHVPAQGEGEQGRRIRGALDEPVHQRVLPEVERGGARDPRRLVLSRSVSCGTAVRHPVRPTTVSAMPSIRRSSSRAESSRSVCSARLSLSRPLP